MTVVQWSLCRVSAFLTLALLGLPLGNTSWAQDQPAAAAEAPEEQAAQPQATDESDPYEVPTGGVDELLSYLQTGPRKMNPTTMADALRMFKSLDAAAEKVYTSSEATLDQRKEMIRARSRYLGRLKRFGERKADERLKKFLNLAARDPAPELQAVAAQALLDMKISNWSELKPGERNAVLADLPASATGDQASADSLVAMMKLADAVSETSDAPKVAEMIEEVLPRLADTDDPEIAERIPRLQGIVRRLQLPGNAIELEGTFLNGDELDWSTYRGKVVLVDYWATWCGPCLAQLPNMKAAYENYHDKGFEILAISLDDSREALETFLESRELPWRTLFSDDEEATGWQHPMASKYAINGIPRAILVNQEGKVVSMNLHGAELERALADLLGPAGTAATDTQTETTARSQP